jgi:hypothetical protein
LGQRKSPAPEIPGWPNPALLGAKTLLDADLATVAHGTTPGSAEEIVKQVDKLI